jgi:lipopolysaccharide cholinephosphotransferase
LYGVFLDVCDKLKVKAWILFGSIIGYIRHKGIIPWEWDIDVGVSTEDY